MKPKVIERQILAIYFNKDGKLFDFVSRTTPTSGKDQTFLGQIIQGVSKAPTSLPSAGGS
ncbi:SmpA/OmlA protein [Brucella melitensis]|nr:SmpA/OmlA protein [Brucella melitensis]